MTLTDTGTVALHGSLLWRWTRARDLTNGFAVFAWDFADDPSGPFFSVAPSHSPTKMVCRHEHRRADDAAHCADVRTRIRQVEADAMLTRAAMFSAPEGALFMAHCGRYWSARHGGACGDCGAPADVLPARVKLRWDSPNAWVWMTTEGVGVHHALEASLAPRDQTRQMDSSAAVVSDATLALRDALRDRLIAAGWEVDAPAPKVRPPPVLRVVRREWEQMGLLGMGER